MRRAVLDVTVFVSGLAKGGPGATKVLDAWRAGSIQVITSRPILREMTVSLLAEGATRADVLAVLVALRQKAIVVRPIEEITACRDGDDNKILEAAIAGNAHYIVSDDKDLRVLSPFRDIDIVTVNRFLRRLGIRKTP